MDNLRNLFSAIKLCDLLVFVGLKMFRAKKELEGFKIKRLFCNWISPKNYVELDCMIYLRTLYLIFRAMA